MLDKPDTTIFALKIEVSALEICNLRDDLDAMIACAGNYHKPSEVMKQLRNDLTDMLGKARVIFYPEKPNPSPMCTCPEGERPAVCAHRYALAECKAATVRAKEGRVV